MTPYPVQVVRGPLAQAMAHASPKGQAEARIAAEVHQLAELTDPTEAMKFLYHLAAGLSRRVKA